MTDTILYDAADGIATITLNRPESLNALLPEMSDRLAELVDQADADDAVRVIVLTGAGKAFSAGADLKLMGRPDRLGRSALVGRQRTLHGAAVVERLLRREKPMLAAVNGVAAGMACSFVLACDFAVAADSARFVFSFVKVGFIPDCGCTFLLPRRVGLANAQRLCLTAEPSPPPRRCASAWSPKSFPPRSSRRARGRSRRASPRIRRTRCAWRAACSSAAPPPTSAGHRGGGARPGRPRRDGGSSGGGARLRREARAGVHRQVMETLGAFLDAVTGRASPSARRSPTRRASASRRGCRARELRAASRGRGQEAARRRRRQGNARRACSARTASSGCRSRSACCASAPCWSRSRRCGSATRSPTGSPTATSRCCSPCRVPQARLPGPRCARSSRSWRRRGRGPTRTRPRRPRCAA